jgi:1,2-dihydroxy-3-keto-5-methylthiopentene dioxygenase
MGAPFARGRQVMAKLEYRGKTYNAESDIRSVLAEYGIPFERWGVRASGGAADDQVLSIYKPEVDRLMKERGYVSVDLVALKPATPNLDVLLAKFDKEHHHIDDEVRFTVEGEGVFEIEADRGEFVKFTSEPGDLIVIPANRRHLFYLTDKRTIRTIRLFLTKEGWEAIYEKKVAN